jgi:hypothetical protein
VNNDLSDLVLTDGQLVIGDSGDAPVAASLTGTADEIIVTNGPGSITLSTPQTIAPTSNPTFNNLTVSTINGKIGNDLVTGPASSTNNDVCSFNGTTGEVIQDSGISTSLLFLKDGSVTMTGNIDVGSFGVGSGANANGGVCFGTKCNLWRKFVGCYWMMRMPRDWVHLLEVELLTVL